MLETPKRQLETPFRLRETPNRLRFGARNAVYTPVAGVYDIYGPSQGRRWQRSRSSPAALDLEGRIDVKNAKSAGVSVFETLFETSKPGVSTF